MPVDAATARRAAREGWTTYSRPTNNAVAGFLAGLCIMLIPVFVRLLAATAAFIGEYFTRGYFDYYVAFMPNIQSIRGYVGGMFVFILAGGAIGAWMAGLRRRIGFRSRRVVHYGYRSGFRLQAYPHQLVGYVAGPVLLIGMIVRAYGWEHAGQNVLNFSLLWLPSGFFGMLLWEWIHVWLIRLFQRRDGELARDLQKEYEVRIAVQDEMELEGADIREIEVTADGVAVLRGQIRDALVPRLRQVVGTIHGIQKIEVAQTAEQSEARGRPGA